MDDEAISNYEAMEAQAMADRERYEESQFDEEIEPSEEEVALQGLDDDHVGDYLTIRNAVARTDLAERLIDMAVKVGLKQRT